MILMIKILMCYDRLYLKNFRIAVDCVSFII